MSSDLFYPTLTRREKYRTNKNGEPYATYAAYYEEIEEDCKSRCVYCDAMKIELGGDKMQLDHFRPQDYFNHLANDPKNLVLACSKCNRLKWNHWPPGKGSKKLVDANGQGFIEPFKDGCRNYFEVDVSGTISSKKTPGEYVIKLLKIDRYSRKILRRRRIIRLTIQRLHLDILDRMKALENAAANNSVALNDISILISMQEKIIALEKLCKDD